jgi:surfactin family lipopeptide synthetase A
MENENQKNFRNQCPERADGSFIAFEKTEIEQSIPCRFEGQVRKYPQRIAVHFGNVELTYEELNRWSNRIAHFLLADRAPEPEPVALLFEEGPSAIKAILGVLKSGKI